MRTSFLAGHPICYSHFTADLRFGLRNVWRDIADMNPLSSDNKLVTYRSWFASPLLNLQADSHTLVQNGSALMMPCRYLYLDLPKHAVESSILRNVNGHCDECSRAAVQNEVHVLFHCQDLFVCCLGKKYSFLLSPFLWRPLISCMPCLVRTAPDSRAGGRAPEMGSRLSTLATCGFGVRTSLEATTS